jgi:hypothetical protein
MPLKGFRQILFFRVILIISSLDTQQADNPCSILGLQKYAVAAQYILLDEEQTTEALT